MDDPVAPTTHERRLAAMVEVARKLTSRLDLAAVLDTVADAAREVFGGEAGFRLVEGDELVLYRATAVARQVMVKERLKIGESISGRVAATGEPIVSVDIATDPRIIDEHRGADRDRAGVLMCVPIRGGSRILGTLNIYRAHGQRFDGADVDLALSLAAQAGVALENARLYDEATRRRREAETLARIGVTLTERLDVVAVSQQIVESAQDLLHTRTSTLRLLDPDGSLRGVAFGGRMRSALAPGHLHPPGAGIGGLAIATGQATWTPDVQTDSRVTLSESHREVFRRVGISALLSVPLRVRGKVIGVLNVGDVAGRMFSDADVALLQTFADQAAMAFENARLYREALEAYRQLSETQAQFLQSQKMEAIGRLAGGIAHDFNNILTIIFGRAELLLATLPPSDRARRHVDTIARTTARATALTRQLLAFSRRQTLDRTALDLNAVVGGMHTMLAQLIGEDIVLDAVLADDAGAVLGDRGQLEQVLTNLAVNARDAMPSGGRLVIETGHAVLDAAFVAANAGASIGAHGFFRVTDTGTGIAPEILPKIFEPFFTTRPPGHGTGLGLSTVDGIVRQHGGGITVRSTVGEGSVFTIYVPSAEDAAETCAPRAPEPSEVRRGNETILLVEDEDELRLLACEMLESAGFTVRPAATGATALELCRGRGPIDLLLTDVVMPGMSGADLAAEVRKSWPGTRVLYMSGYPAHPSGQAELVTADAPLLAKPFTAAVLTAVVRATLDAR